MSALTPLARTLAKGRTFATLTTLRSDGSPTAQVMWIDCDEDHLLINTETHRAKYRHMRADPRVAIVLVDSADPYRYVEVRGIAEEFILGERALDHIDSLSHRYFGRPYDRGIIASERVLVRIAPTSIHPAGR
ncbi:PPOX class F420-dependent oxidoreductase [Demequina sp. NBRC 110054]|uniref:PPOX class F420-dependent oxidoreductase n=1 Tax=Demequina sp. NBRC 110054 TaxID=1570343 RepID=UPI000A03F9F8|nr:PPOX class F420-dependent oxidoreductase [Demequina sp. NBRC 110054]